MQASMEIYPRTAAERAMKLHEVLLRASAGKVKWWQAAELMGISSPRYSGELALLYERERQRGNANRAALAVARKMVAYLLAVDRRSTDFILAGKPMPTATV